MIKKFVIGHKNPDTDSVVSAIVFSKYLKNGAVPTIAGELNRETSFVFSFLKEKKPKLLKKAPVNSKFYLVDHGGLEQSIVGINPEDILGVIDHHQMLGLTTVEPIFYRAEVLGSTSTILAKMFQEKGKKIDKRNAGLLLSGIISDTLKLTSKTTTIEDKSIAKELAKISGINIKELAQKMFEAKSDISGMSIKDIVLSDYKEYKHLGKNIGIGVFETVLTAPFKGKDEKILEVLADVKKETKADLVFFGLVDILKKETFLYLLSEKEDNVSKKAFGVSGDRVVLLKGVTSRKKQLVPCIFKSIQSVQL